MDESLLIVNNGRQEYLKENRSKYLISADHQGGYVIDGVLKKRLKRFPTSDSD
jgi:hypothetical protein